MNKQFYKKLIIILIPIIVCLIIFIIIYDSLFGIFSGTMDSVIYRNGDDLSFVTVLDVGEAQSILICSKGKAALIDTGNDNYRVLELLRKYGIRELEFIILSHYHNDHIGGLENICDSIEVNRIYASERQYSDEFYVDYLYVNELSYAYDIDFNKAYEGLHLKLGEIDVDVVALFDYFEDENDKSLVISIDHFGDSVLVLSDISSKCENIFPKEKNISSVAVVAAHHGSSGSNSEDFLLSTRSKNFIVSCGIFAENNHPSEEFVDRINSIGAKLYTTNEYGNIRIDFNKYSSEISYEVK